MDCSLEDHGIQTVVHSKSGSMCQIHEFGATILCYHPNPDKYSEVLFVSRDAVLNGTKAIRGGIPLVFPIFGPPADKENDDMPQHGFARRNFWKMDKSSLSDTETEAAMDFTLTVAADNDKIDGRGTKGLWAPSATTSPACELRYRIVVKDESLTTTLTMTNTGTIAFPVQALFHTYYEVHGKAALDTSKCSVTGLQGYDMVDKVDPDNSKSPDSTEAITILKETDRVYSPPDGKNEVNVTLQLDRPTHTPIMCTAKGSVDGTVVPVSCVVWNPHEEKAKAMSDFGDDQHHEMICVEPGILGKPILEPGKQAVLEQVIAVSTTS
ncbi:Glucose-6-phosphate 1-epimerase [Seminavis robusta]|uniref:glucose-6-phosphate 1-epimerase n=1 Tax=Seminavis robusta TaxID=568900 RepID=A0A9N8HC13_9STRA|nr:Glucose-6-phosphate 1-epimerase [Seminavis robusta]|eukprot:Sro300_g111740.1 Glucose-6-phosphate 1-epimerase (324) ;mRNA; f:33808-34779